MAYSHFDIIKFEHLTMGKWERYEKHDWQWTLRVAEQLCQDYVKKYISIGK